MPDKVTLLFSQDENLMFFNKIDRPHWFFLLFTLHSQNGINKESGPGVKQEFQRIQWNHFTKQNWMSIKFKKRNPQSIISQSLQSKKKVAGIHAVNFKVSFVPLI